MIERGRSIFGWGKSEEEKAAVRERAIKLKPYQLVPILKWAYGPKEWKNRTDEYWENQWDQLYLRPEDKEEWRLETKRMYGYLKSILYWAYNKDSEGKPLEDSDTQGHLDPLPGIRVHNGEDIYREPNWEDPREVDQAVAELAIYYFNEGQPEKMMPVFIVNEEDEDELLAVGTIRWRGDKYVPKEKRIASIERVIVNPDHREEGVGFRLVSSMIDYAFHEYQGYQGSQSAKEIRTWIMADREAGDYRKNERFFEDKLGFRLMAGDWKKYANERLNLKTDRNARWWTLSEEVWEEVKKNNPDIKPML